MLKQLMTIAVAAGLMLPWSAFPESATRVQAEKDIRTGEQATLQKGTPASGAQERIEERSRTREETQTRERTGEAAQVQSKEQKRSGGGAETLGTTVSGDQLKDRDRDRLRDKDKDLDRLHDRDRVRDRIHDPAGSAARQGGGRR